MPEKNSLEEFAKLMSDPEKALDLALDALESLSDPLEKLLFHQLWQGEKKLRELEELLRRLKLTHGEKIVQIFIKMVLGPIKDTVEAANLSKFIAELRNPSLPKIPEEEDGIIGSDGSFTPMPSNKK